MFPLIPLVRARCISLIDGIPFSLPFGTTLEYRDKDGKKRKIVTQQKKTTQIDL